MIPAGDLDPRVARGYDRLAPMYDVASRLFPGDALRAAAEVLLARVPRGARALVAGGGSGRILPALLARAPDRVVWIDASPAMTARARARVPGAAPVEFRVGGLERLDAGERFDAIVTPFFLDQFEGARLGTVVGRLAGALEPDGTWVHADFVRDRARLATRLLYGLFRATCAIEASTLPDWDATFARAGLVIRERRPGLGGWVCAFRLERPSGGG